jgi:hypothetical protein
MEHENIQVCLRLRPISDKEAERGEESIWNIYDNTAVGLKREWRDHLLFKKSSSKSGTFIFDRCYPGETTNDDIYKDMLRKVIGSCLNGINGTIFMYGQTGSGKTYTMMGYQQKEGLYNKASRSPRPRKPTFKNVRDAETRSNSSHVQKQFEDLHENITLDPGKSGSLIQAFAEIFDAIEKSTDRTFFVKCSYIEIYNDQVYDLLQRTENLGETLQVCEDPGKESFFIRGVREESVDSVEEIIDKLKRGEVNRHYARTLMNHSSSRSHAIFRIYVQAVASPWLRGEKAQAGESLVTESWLNFVDLAGSERVSAHDKLEQGDKTKERIKEGQHINKS